MKLVIHCGLHKTATSSFQQFCHYNRSTLFDIGVYYPKYKDKNQHSYLIHDIQNIGMSSIHDFLIEAYAEVQGDCHTVLLSGENFENCIVDVALAADIETTAYKAGFESVTWVVVTREQDSLLKSLYSELSKHGVTLRLDNLKSWAEKRGCLFISASKCNHIFVLDYRRFEDRFKRHTSGTQIELPFEDFVREYTGMVLFERLLPENNISTLRERAIFSNDAVNTRLSEYNIEANYVATALKVERIRKRPYSFLLLPLILLRNRKT